MIEWKEYKLSEITTKVGSGATPRGGQESYKNEGISLIRSQNILDFEFSRSGLAFIDDEQASQLSNVKVLEDDILLNITGDSVARVCKVPKSILPARVNQHVSLVRAKKDKVIPDYILYYLLNPSFKKYMLMIASDGATRNALTKGEIEDFDIRVPPKDIQIAIASIFSNLDSKIDLLRRQNQTLENIAQTLFKRWFVDFEFPDQNGKPYKSSGGKMVESELGEIPEGWDVEILGYHLKTVLGGTPSTQNKSFWENGTTGWINSGKINEFRIIEPTAFITEEAVKKSATKLLPKGAIVLAITGATLGQISRLEFDCCANQSVVGILPNKTFCSGYIYCWINNQIEYLLLNASGGAQQHVNKENVNELTFLIPTNNILKKFALIVEPIMERISNSCFEMSSLSKTRDTLLPKLMSGQIRVKNL